MRDLAQLRARYLLALAIFPACQRAEPTGSSSTAPTTTTATIPTAALNASPTVVATASATSVPTVTASASASPSATPSAIGSATAGASADKPGGSPLPPEPQCMMCMNTCQPELTTPVPHPFPAPFARCETSLPGGGTFSVDATKAARISNPSQCCYRFSNRHPPLGRPFRDGDALRVADRAHRSDWSTPVTPSLAGLSSSARRSLADAWARDAASEHASVAAFARFALQLLAVGAPADLLEAAHEAALDEINHARVSYAIASTYAGEAIGPAPLTIASASIETSLAVMAVETFLDGCIAETRAAIVARDKATLERDPAVRDVLTTIADDEERHAELAWRTVAWALRTGGNEVHEAIAAAAATAFASSPVDDVVREIVRPCIEAALASEGDPSLRSG